MLYDIAYRNPLSGLDATYHIERCQCSRERGFFIQGRRRYKATPNHIRALIGSEIMPDQAEDANARFDNLRGRFLDGGVLSQIECFVLLRCYEEHFAATETENSRVFEGMTWWPT